jgi:hypothetical protein
MHLAAVARPLVGLDQHAGLDTVEQVTLDKRLVPAGVVLSVQDHLAEVDRIGQYVPDHLPHHRRALDLGKPASDDRDVLAVIEAFEGLGNGWAKARVEHNLARLVPLVAVRQPAVVKVLCQRVQDGLAHSEADLTLALFFLQFLPWRERVQVLGMALHAASDNGAILIAEKVRPTEVRWAEIAADCSHDWKEQHGISDAAIRAKARALHGVLVPHTVADLSHALAATGWEQPEVLFRWHQWVLVGAFTRRGCHVRGDPGWPGAHRRFG